MWLEEPRYTISVISVGPAWERSDRQACGSEQSLVVRRSSVRGEESTGDIVNLVFDWAVLWKDNDVSCEPTGRLTGEVRLAGFPLHPSCGALAAGVKRDLLRLLVPVGRRRVIDLYMVP